jgi:hypothetical protein
MAAPATGSRQKNDHRDPSSAMVFATEYARTDAET